MTEHLVIVGGGQAAAQAVQSLRQQNFAGPITLVADEAYPPYQRPPLSKKYLAGELTRERLLLRPAAFYAEKGVTLVPLRVYFKDGRAKVELATARGKARYDKRQALAERDAKRETERAMKGARD
jgi:3-phenylpropionate/trans-cinnamate dioxygenase ferredoxin reductase subunit